MESNGCGACGNARIFRVTVRQPFDIGTALQVAFWPEREVFTFRFHITPPATA